MDIRGVDRVILGVDEMDAAQQFPAATSGLT